MSMKNIYAFEKIYAHREDIWCFQNYTLIENIGGYWIILYACWKILVNIKTYWYLKGLWESKIFIVFAEIYTNWKNISCFYILKNSKIMTWSATWYSDIV